MFGSIKTSIQLVKESFRVLRHDPELVLLTAFSFIGVAIVVILAGVATLGTGAIDSEGKAVLINSTGYIVLALAYFLGYFLIIYFQVALVCAVQLRMVGGDQNVWYGIAEANRRLSAILSWTVIAATVGFLLGILEGAARSRRGGPLSLFPLFLSK